MRGPRPDADKCAQEGKDPLRAGSGLGVASVFRGVRHCARLRPPPRLRSGLRAAAPWRQRSRTTSRSPAAPQEAFASSRSDPTAGDDVLVGLAFSGGGTRAAAFSYGVLQEIDQTTVRTRNGTHSLLEQRRLRLRRVRRLGHRRLLRPEEARRARRFPREIPDPQRRGGAYDQRRSDQPGQGAGRRRQRHPHVLALARQEPVRRRDLRRLPQDAGPAGLDQRLRHLQPHAVHLRRGDLHRAVQRSRDLSDRGRGRGVGGGADRVHADGDQDLSEANAPTSRRIGCARRTNNPERAADAQGASPTRCTTITTARSKYVKLLDGGLVDNFGLSGFTISRLSARTPHEPLSPEQAVRLQAL